MRFEELNYDPDAAGEYTRISNAMFDRVCELYEKAEAEDKKRGR